MKLFSLKNKGTKRILNIFGVKIKWQRKGRFQQPDISYFENKFKELQSANQTQLNELLAYNKLTLMGMYPGYSLKDISKKVFSSYPKATGFLQEVQQCNLRLMSDFKSFCDSLNIKFWLHAGTLIGAIRNNGFIQWDDDVDVAMTRNDFNIAKTNLKNNKLLKLYEYYNEVTCSRQYQLKYQNGNIPVFIDIAIYDSCNAVTPAEQSEFWEKYHNSYQELLNRFKNELGAPAIIDIGYHKVGLYAENTKKKVDEIIDNAVNQTTTNTDNLSKEPSFFYSIQNYPFIYPIMKYGDLYPLQPVNFENLQFYIPANPEYYLLGYGNIYLPPQDIETNPHIYAFEPFRKEIREFLEKTND